MSAAVDFAVPALLVSGAALLALALARDASPRLGAWIALAGLAAWVIPWPLIDLPLRVSSQGSSWLAVSTAPLDLLGYEVRVMLDAASSALGATPTTPMPASVWLLVPLPGLVWFAAECVLHARRLRDWRRMSRDGEHLRRLLPGTLAPYAPRIRVLPGCALAATTGLLRPVIWIGAELGDEQALRTALIHECCHAAARDQLRLKLIVLVKRLHWWNPVVVLLARRAELLLEAACDQHCVRWLGRRRYTRALAGLMLSAHERSVVRLAPMLCTASMNVLRLARLERGVRTDWRAPAAVVLCIGAGVAAAHAQPLADPRLGTWLETTRSSPDSPILRRFEDRGAGVTRVHSFIGTDGRSSTWSDERCDGRRYPVMDADGAPVALTSSCVIRDARTVEFAFHHRDGSGHVDRGIEWVSSDGSVYTVTFETADRDGVVLQTVQRQFRRFDGPVSAAGQRPGA